jgi:hypothetical protein
MAKLAGITVWRPAAENMTGTTLAAPMPTKP